MPTSPDSPSRGLPEWLPEYYRENPRETGTLLKIAEEMFAQVSARLDAAGGRLNDDLMSALKDRWFPWGPPAGPRPHHGCPGVGGVSRREFFHWCRDQRGGVPVVWAGFVVASLGVDRLELRRSRRPAAVIVWGGAGLSESRPLAIPPDMVPLRTRLQVILPLSEEDVRVSCHGTVLKARILFDSHAADVESMTGG